MSRRRRSGAKAGSASPATPRTWLGDAARAVLEAATLASVVAVALYFNPRTERVFEPDKLAWVLVLGLVCYWAHAARLLEGGRPRARRPSPLPAAAVAAIAVYALGAAASIAPDLSFWGLYRRGQGVFVLLAFGALFWAALVVLGRPGAFDRLRRALLLATVGASSYALLQRAGLDNLTWDAATDAAARPFGPLGNPIFLGAFLVLSLPVLASFLLERWPDARRSGPGARRQWAAHGFGVALGVAALVASQSRGPTLGLLAAGLVFAVLLLAMARRARAAAALVALAAAAAVGLWAAGGAGVGAFGRLAGLAWAGSRTATERILVWRSLVDAWRADGVRAVLGHGPETTPLLVTPRLPADLVALAPDQVFDRAHSAGWEWWVAAGLLGVAVWLALYVAALVTGLCATGLLRHRRARLIAGATLFAGAGTGALAVAAAGRPELWALGAPLGLVAALLAVSLVAAARPPAEVAPARAGQDRPPIGPIAVAALMAAVAGHLVEGAVGLPTAAGELVFWVFLAAIGVAGSARSVREHPPPVRDGAAGWADGWLDGLALATVAFAPLLVPGRPSAIGQPALYAVPVLLWVTGDLSALGPVRASWIRPAARLVMLGLMVGLLVPAGRWPWGPALAYLGVLGLAVAALARSLASVIPGARSPALRPVLGLGALALVCVLAAWRLALAPVAADAHIRAGMERAAAGDVAGARVRFERAVALWPQQSAYAAYVSAAHRETLLDPEAGEAARRAAFEAAEAALLAAEERVPDGETAWLLVALYRERGDLAAHPTERLDWWSRALSRSEVAMERAPRDAEGLMERAAVLERLGEPRAAGDAFRAAAALRPDLPSGWLGSARSRLATGDVDGAVADVGRALEVADPGAVLRAAAAATESPARGLASGQAVVLARALSGDVAGARELLSSLREIAPEDPVSRDIGDWLADRRSD